MKKLFTVLYLLSINAFCQTKPATASYTINNSESQIIWKGTQVLGGGHEGTIQLNSGVLEIAADGKVKGGSFVINMKSIDNTDIKPEKSSNELEEHLKSDDFFSVFRYPTATFIITRVTPGSKPGDYLITGNFTLKGIVNSISFPARIAGNTHEIKAQATFFIDRTRWGINYKAYSFLSQVKDELISNDIKLSLNLVFNKPQ